MTTRLPPQSWEFGPPDPPMECSWCDGHSTIELGSITKRTGATIVLAEGTVMDCPRCEGTGDEPKLGPEDDPRVP